eukprot:359650-Chlamydomonas_euryale.AAC.16
MALDSGRDLSRGRGLHAVVIYGTTLKPSYSSPAYCRSVGYPVHGMVSQGILHWPPVCTYVYKRTCYYDLNFPRFILGACRPPIISEMMLRSCASRAGCLPRRWHVLISAASSGLNVVKMKAWSLECREYRGACALVASS